jgi:hypothetical protein
MDLFPELAGMGDDFGPVTAGGLSQLLRSHDPVHLAGLRWLAARRQARVSRI